MKIGLVFIHQRINLILKNSFNLSQYIGLISEIMNGKSKNKFNLNKNSFKFFNF